jgi:hypothetical protein
VIAGLLPHLRQQRKAKAHAAQVLAEVHKRDAAKPIKHATSPAKSRLVQAQTSPTALFETFSLASATAAAPAATSRAAAAAAAAARRQQQQPSPVAAAATAKQPASKRPQRSAPQQHFAAWSLTDNLAQAARDGTSSADLRAAAVRAEHAAERAQQDAAFEQSLEDDR